jgi:hypothetical protein
VVPNIVVGFVVVVGFVGVVVVGGVVVTAGVPIPFGIVAEVTFCGVRLGSTGCMDTAACGVSVATRAGMFAVNTTDSVAWVDSARGEPVTTGAIVDLTIGLLESPGGTTVTGTPTGGWPTGSR